MNNKTIIGVIGAALVFALAAAWFFLRPAPKPPETPLVSASEETARVSSAMETSEMAQSSVSSGVEKANPFGADVNPVSGYKNPFE